VSLRGSVSGELHGPLDHLGPAHVVVVEQVRGQVQVRAVEGGHHLGGVAQTEPGHDVVAGRGSGRRRQRHHRRVPQPLDHGAQPQVLRPEVVPPLGDAVRLVDDEQRDTGGAQRVDDLVVGQLLGGEEHVLGRAVAQLVPRTAGLRGALGGVDHDGVGRVGTGEPLALVALQGDQRGDDHRRAVQEQGGDLVDRGLARSGGQHGQHVAAVRHGLHRLQLFGTQLRPAEGLLCDAAELGARSSRHGARATPPGGAPIPAHFRGSWPQFINEYRHFVSVTSPFGRWARWRCT
jgi:hypothetical protein